MEEWEEAQIVAISSNSSLPDSNVEYPQKATLQNFGFTSSKNISPTKNWPTNKIKKSTFQLIYIVDRKSIIADN